MDVLSEAGRSDGRFAIVKFALLSASRARGYSLLRGAHRAFRCLFAGRSSLALSKHEADAIRTQTGLTWQVGV